MLWYKHIYTKCSNIGTVFWATVAMMIMCHKGHPNRNNNRHFAIKQDAQGALNLARGSVMIYLLLFTLSFSSCLTHTRLRIAASPTYVFHFDDSWGCAPRLYSMFNHAGSTLLWLHFTYINSRVAKCTLAYSWEPIYNFSFSSLSNSTC